MSRRFHLSEFNQHVVNKLHTSPQFGRRQENSNPESPSRIGLVHNSTLPATRRRQRHGNIGNNGLLVSLKSHEVSRGGSCKHKLYPLQGCLPQLTRNEITPSKTSHRHRNDPCDVITHETHIFIFVALLSVTSTPHPDSGRSSTRRRNTTGVNRVPCQPGALSTNVRSRKTAVNSWPFRKATYVTYVTVFASLTNQICFRC